MTTMVDEKADTVLDLAGGGWMVASKSVPGAWRLVTFHESRIACSCPAGVRMPESRVPCRHARLVAARESKAVPPRPPAPAGNLGRFVD